jgi:hypothetical protein
MTTKEELYRLVDRLPEEEWDAARRFLEFLCSPQRREDTRPEPETPPGPE